MSKYDRKISRFEDTMEKFWNAVEASPEHLNVAIIPIQLIDEIGIMLKSARDNEIKLKEMKVITPKQKPKEEMPDTNVTADKLLDKIKEAPQLIEY
jgi:hypothetical protein